MNPMIITWPPERFFWATLEAPGWKRTGPAPVGFLDAVAEDLPIPVDDLHAVGVPLGEGRILIVGALKRELTNVPAEAAALMPAAAPPELAEIAVGMPNLLCGPFEPAAARKARVRRHAAWAALAAACALMVTIGAERWGRAWMVTADRARAAWTQAVLERTGGADPGLGAFKLARQAEFAGVAARAPELPDAALALAGLLEAWPEGAAATPQSISIRDQSATVSVIAPDAAAFLKEFAPPPGWALDQPMLSAAGDAQRLTLTMRRSEAGS